MTLDHERIEALVDVLRESTGLTELEVRQNGSVLRLRRPAPARAVRPRVAAPADITTNGAGSEAPDVSLERLPPVVTTLAHFVGIFRATRPHPVGAGDSVTENQSLGQIEAMRLMNDCPAPVAGRVQAVLVQDGQPVEYGQALFEIVPEESQ